MEQAEIISEEVTTESLEIGIINKIVITEEAEFDYEQVVNGQQIPKETIEVDVETYIDILNKEHRLLNDYYFRVKFFDEQSEKMLRLFFYKGERFGVVQLWRLCGVCEADDWTEEQEDDGQIRVWLKSSLSFFPKEDWVWDLRLNEANQRWLLENAENENYGEDYKKMVKTLLKNYNLNMSRVAVGDKEDVELVALADKMTFLQKCIKNLDEEAKEIIVDVYLKGNSIKKVGNKYGYSKSGMFKKCNRAIEILEMLFSDRYKI